MWCWTILEDPESSWARLSNSLSSNHGHGDHGASTFCVPFSSLGERCHLVVLVMHPLILVIFRDVSWYWMNDLDMCFASWKLQGDGPLESPGFGWSRSCGVFYARKMGPKQTPWQKWPRSLPFAVTSIQKYPKKSRWNLGEAVMTCTDHEVSTATVRSRTCTLVTSTSCTVPPCQEVAKVTFGWTMKDSPKSACRVLRSLPSLEKASWLFSHQNYGQNRWSFTWRQPVATGLLSVSLSTISMFLFLHVPGNPQIYQIWIFLHK